MKTFKIILSAFVLSFLAVSCLVDDEADVNFGNGPYVIGFKSDVAIETYFTDEGTVTKEYPVNVLGGSDGTLIDKDITVTYEIDPSSTAVEGNEFDFVTTGGSLTIPAGQSFVGFPLKINTGNFNPTEKTELILTLTATSSDDAVVSAINNKLSITFVGCLSVINEFTYDVVTTRSDGAVYNVSTESFTVLGVNEFLSESTGGFGPGGVRGSYVPPAPYNGFKFVDVCGELTIPSQNLIGYYSNLVYGTGSVDPVTGDIIFHYTITFSDGNSEFESVFTKQ